jgi:hypothetical protein
VSEEGAYVFRHKTYAGIFRQHKMTSENNVKKVRTIGKNKRQASVPVKS